MLYCDYSCISHVFHYAAKSQILEDNASLPSVVFLLDTSGSIGSGKFDNIKKLLADVAVNISMSGVKVGVVNFSSSPFVDVHLQLWKNDVDSLRNLIRRITFVGKGTNIKLPLESAVTELGQEGSRVIVLFSDGRYGGDSEFKAATTSANKAKKAGIIIYSVGVSTIVNLNDLEKLSSFQPRKYNSASFNSVNIILDIMKIITSESERDGMYTLHGKKYDCCF